MKKLIYSALIFILTILILFACANTGRTIVYTPSNKIVIYTSMYDEIVDNLERILERQFPNVDIEFARGGTGTLQYRIEEEIQAGRLGCDIIMVADPSFSLELKERGIIHPYKSREAPNLAFDYDPDGYWYPVRISSMVMAFNPDRNAKNTLPASFFDFANDPSVTGAISMTNPLSSGTSLAAVTALRDKYGYEYFDALGRQGATIETSAISLNKLAAGEYKVIMVLEEAILRLRELEKSKLEIIYPSDGAVVIPSTIMIVNERWSANNNIRLAQAITDWFLSANGQNAIVDGWMHSVRANFDREPFDAISSATIKTRGTLLPVNWNSILTQKNEILTKFEENVIYRSR
jgi:iron(III) transport system substrate-binding protein